MADIETTIIGAGVVGLAIGRALAMAGQEILTLERNSCIGNETSSRNSEVIHAGIYYPKDSLKARFCVEGKKKLYAFCESHNVPFQRLGKIIVAKSREQLGGLAEISKKALRNGVDDIRYLDENDLKKLEPELYGKGGLLSPSTGIFDSHAFMLALQGDAENYGAQFAFNSEAYTINRLTNGDFEVRTRGQNSYAFTTKNLVASCGLHATVLMQRSPLNWKQDAPQTYFAKGNYFSLTGKAPFSHLIYPMPEPGGLGVHYSPDMGGQARFGPDVEWIEQIDYPVDPERGEKFYDAIRSYWPDIVEGSLRPDYSGIRPKLSKKGEPSVDFLIADEAFHGQSGLVALFGIESPGLTSSLAIADYVGHKLGLR